MEESFEFAPGTPAHWKKLRGASPEAVEASRQAWYIVPGASRSAYRESKMPPGTDGRLQLAFTMCQLALGSYAHMDLDELAEEARQFIKERLPQAERKRRSEARLATYPVLFEAYSHAGMDGVYNRAGLSDSERRIASLWFQHPEGAIDDIKLRDEEIARVMNYKSGENVRKTRSRINKKLHALIEEEGA